MKIFNPETYARAVAAIDRNYPRFSAEREFGLYANACAHKLRVSPRVPFTPAEISGGLRVDGEPSEASDTELAENLESLLADIEGIGVDEDTYSFGGNEGVFLTVNRTIAAAYRLRRRLRPEIRERLSALFERWKRSIARDANYSPDDWREHLEFVLSIGAKELWLVSAALHSDRVDRRHAPAVRTAMTGGSAVLDCHEVLAGLRLAFFAEVRSSEWLAGALDRLWAPVQALGIVARVPIDWTHESTDWEIVAYVVACAHRARAALSRELRARLRDILKGWAATTSGEPHDGATPEQRLDFAGDPTLVTGEELLFVLEELMEP